MRVQHATFDQNRESILKLGLCVRFSKSRVRRVWIHKRPKQKWAVNHVCKRHRGKEKDVIIVVLNVPETWLHRYADGVYYCDRDIPPAHIESVE